MTLARCVAAMLVVALPLVANAQSRSIEMCVAARQASFEAAQEFRQKGSVTCPPSRLGGFPPREVKYRRSSTVTFTAPDDLLIDDRPSTAPTARSMGRAVNVSLSSDKKTVSAPVSCESAGVKAGPKTVTTTIKGSIISVASDRMRNEWLVTCALQEATK